MSTLNTIDLQDDEFVYYSAVNGLVDQSYLKDYLNLNVNLSHLYKQWSEVGCST